MAVVIGADFQMFVLWKEARDPFNPSHFTRGKDARVTWPQLGPLKEEKHQWCAFRVLLFWKMKYRFIYVFYFILFYFCNKAKKFEVWIVLAYFLLLLTETEGSCCAKKGHLVYSQTCIVYKHFVWNMHLKKKNRGGQKSVYGSRNVKVVTQM